MKKATGKRRTNGDGTIYFSESRNRWYAEIMWTDKTGKRNAKKFSSARQSVVKNKLNEFRKNCLSPAATLTAVRFCFMNLPITGLKTQLKTR